MPSDALVGRGVGISPPQVIMPRRKPVATASARSFAPSLRKSRRAWVLMVSSDRQSSRPICALLLPWLIPVRTCISRIDNVTGGVSGTVERTVVGATPASGLAPLQDPGPDCEVPAPDIAAA